MVAEAATERLHAPFGMIDLSLAPTSAVGDSVAQVRAELGLESCGGPGTTAALALLNDVVKKGGLMASSSVGGLSGAFIPVSEDLGMIEAVEKGDIKCVPELFKKNYMNWMNGTRDWCISRQLWWGHRIPAYYYGSGVDDFVVAESLEQAVFVRSRL